GKNTSAAAGCWTWCLAKVKNVKPNATADPARVKAFHGSSLSGAGRAAERGGPARREGGRQGQVGTKPESRSRLTRAAFAELVTAAQGLEVSHTWQGYGSAIFLELGRLRRAKGENNPHGEFSIMLEWSWRVESQRRVDFGSWSSDRKIA